MSVIALDIGTSRLKAILARREGTILATHGVPTPVIAEPGVRHEFPPLALRDAAEELIGRLAQAHPDDPVETLVVSCLGTAMVPVDREGRPLGAALSPADPRPVATPGLRERIDLPDATLFDLTGQDPRLSSFLLQWLWWREHRPGEMDRAYRLRSLRGFLVQGWCGTDAEDPSWASRTMVMDLATDTWSDAVVAAAGLSAELLPAIEPSTSIWSMRAAPAIRLGLAPGARVVLGAMDNCCAFLGATDPAEARLVNICGTYEHMAGVGDPAIARAAAVAVGGLIHRYPLGGRDLSYSRIPVGLLMGEVAAASDVGLDRLLDEVATWPGTQTVTQPTGLPPWLDLDATRMALRAGTLPAAALQEVLEACARVLVAYTDAWVGAGGVCDRIVAVGGGASLSRVLQLKANLLGRAVSTLASAEGAGIGALRLAAIADDGASLDDACARYPNPVITTWLPEPVGTT